MNDLTQRGIMALKSGDRAAARKLLSAALTQDPNDAVAWLWMTGALDTDEDRIACLRQVQRIDPGNQAAERGLAKLLGRRSQAETAAEAGVQEPQTGQAALEQAAAETDAREEAADVSAEASLAAQEASAKSGPLPGEEGAAPAATVISYPVEPGPAVSSGAVYSQPGQVEVLPAEESEAAVTGAATVETVPGEALPAVADAPAAAAEAVTPPARRGRARLAPGEQYLFRARPSLVPALVSFWIFLFGAVAVGIILSNSLTLALIVGGGLFILLELLVVYTVIRNLVVRYEATSQYISLPYQGKRLRVPLADVFHIDCSQTTMQQILGIGHIDLDAVVNGELTRLRMRDIAQCKQKVDRIKSLINEEK